jgi:Zn ribbon nucleic-acid-binding protein
MSTSRFSDQHKCPEDFYCRVLVACPACQKKATATVNNETITAQLVCVHCVHHKTTATTINVNDNRALVKMPAHRYFDAALWLQHSFKNKVFWAYNLEYSI